MLRITNITDAPLQSLQFVLADGTTIFMQIYFIPMQYGWFFNTITYGSLIINGLRITNSPNMLYQWKNQIPFGIACISTANREPSQLGDLSFGATSDTPSSITNLYVLSAAEVAQYSLFLSGGLVV